MEFGVEEVVFAITVWLVEQGPTASLYMVKWYLVYLSYVMWPWGLTAYSQSKSNLCTVLLANLVM